MDTYTLDPTDQELLKDLDLEIVRLSERKNGILLSAMKRAKLEGSWDYDAKTSTFSRPATPPDSAQTA